MLIPSPQAVAASLPAHRPAGLMDLVIGLGSMYLVVLGLLTPLTPSCRVIRAGVVAPAAVLGFLYIAWVPIGKDYEDMWGSSMLFVFFAVKTLEMLVFFPPEESCYRLRPVPAVANVNATPAPKLKAVHPNGHVNGSAQSTSTRSNSIIELMPEPVPPPWTMAKFYWASSLWWSWRGIGWNFAPPLSPSRHNHPFSRSSSRKAFLIYQVTYFAFGLLIQDIVRSFMNCSSFSPFFAGRPGIAPPYSTLGVGQKALYSMCVVVRIITCMEESWLEVACVCVGLGGIMGWEGEIWEPSGWPPLYGSLGDVWDHPGLSTAWSREGIKVGLQGIRLIRLLQLWQQYFRRWLYTFGWVGLGENVLGLPRSGPSPHSAPPNGAFNGTPSRAPITLLAVSGDTQSESGRTSPAHPLPTGGVSNPHPVTPIPTMMSNFIKSLLVFTLTGWLHDIACLILLVRTVPARPDLRWRDALVTTPFFLYQPFGLALEAAVKSSWRAWKAKRHPGWRKVKAVQEKETDVEPNLLRLLEKLVGIAWTWIWLGWTARYWVEGLCQVGVWRRNDVGQANFPSFVGGLVWGRWMH